MLHEQVRTRRSELGSEDRRRYDGQENLDFIGLFVGTEEFRESGKKDIPTVTQVTIV